MVAWEKVPRAVFDHICAATFLGMMINLVLFYSTFPSVIFSEGCTQIPSLFNRASPLSSLSVILTI